jgi:N6-L-threonylcarbamoyladenine synthase
LDLSFSGLKTSVRTFLEHDGGRVSHADIAASFQAAVVDALVDRVARALDAASYKAIVLSGGVAANAALAAAFRALGAKRGVEALVPERRYCTDNAAMIAAAAFRRNPAGRVDPLALTADPNLPFTFGQAA